MDTLRRNRVKSQSRDSNKDVGAMIQVRVCDGLDSDEGRVNEQKHLPTGFI